MYSPFIEPNRFLEHHIDLLHGNETVGERDVNIIELFITMCFRLATAASPGIISTFSSPAPVAWRLHM